jgi:hypothetical protein
MASRDYTSPLLFELPIDEEVRRVKQSYNGEPRELQNSQEPTRTEEPKSDKRRAPAEILIIREHEEE